MDIKGFDDTIAWYNQNASQYAQATHARSHPEQINQFAALLETNAKILDAGCGAGRDTNLLTQKGFLVTGMDLSGGLLSVAAKTYPDIHFVKGDLRYLPFDNESFDGIWAHASLLHLESVEDVTKTLHQFARVLKKNGVLHVFVKAQIGAEKTAVVSDTLSNHNRFFQYFTKGELQSLLENVGFTLFSIEQFRETDKDPNGRPEIEWILALAKKI